MHRPTTRRRRSAMGFRVVRQDDNGVRAVTAYAARAHKQMYWVEPDADETGDPRAGARAGDRR